ncbi:MAG: hypothetical protein ACLQUY_12810 [Ktedonobacterales bacterium]
MLLFHGTTAPALEGILQHGLRPPQPTAASHDWVWELSGRAQGNAVFLSTAPVAGKGGDPVSFALGWPLKHARGSQPGYVVVVDLPPDALEHVHAVVPNSELTAFVSVVRTRSWLRETVRVSASRAAVAAADDDQSALARWTLSHWCLHYWVARWCADHQTALTPSALAGHIMLQPHGLDSALPTDLTLPRWQAFLDDYFRVVDFAYWDIASAAERERRRQAILRRHGIVLPEHIEEDEHCKHCRLCMRGLASFVYRFEGFADYPPLHAFLRTLPMKSSSQRLPEGVRVGSYVMGVSLPDGGLGTVHMLAERLRTVRAHTAPFSEEAVLRFFRMQEASEKSPREAPWSWEQWYTDFPAARCRLPHTWHLGYGQRFSAQDLKQPDRQVIADAIPAQYILGAIKVSDGVRLVPRVRPNRRKDETLAVNLWAMARELRSRYMGVPMLVE